MPDFNKMQRERLAARNQAMPDGGFPIRNVSDLKNAIQAYGRAKNKPAVKAWIKKRARQLGREDLLPENWRTSEVIIHYGVKGMKWGIRKSDRDSKGDYIIKKKSRLGRVSLTEKDPTYDNKKYLSTNRSDQEKWEEYLGSRYAYRGRPTFNIGYKTIKDIKVLSSTHAGEKFVEMQKNDPDFKKLAIKDSKLAYKAYDLSFNEDPSEQIAMNLAVQTETGHRFVDSILKEGYSAIEDQHGKNVSEDPIIVFNPDENLKKTSVDTTKYWRRR